MLIVNPKLGWSKLAGKASWYPFHAGFSPDFVRSILEKTATRRSSCILDPWNGTGTTTESAVALGLHAFGFDLNPAMLVIAKGRLVSESTKPRLLPIAEELLTDTRQWEIIECSTDPLLSWLQPASARHFRLLESSIQRVLLHRNDYQSLGYEGVQQLSNTAAFFYTALFSTLRKSLRKFFTTNPTWIRNPKTLEDRVAPHAETISSQFLTTVRTMIEASNGNCGVHPPGRGTIRLASSEALPLDSDSVDWILTSPPYCTRIDYAVATRPELSLLGFGIRTRHSFDRLRDTLIGSTSVQSHVDPPSTEWGPTCTRFLHRVKNHTSKASGTYYYKQHVQYFRAIYASLSELRRVLRPRGSCVIVVQDSHYKDVHNPLPDMFIEMFRNLGLSLSERRDYETRHVFARMHPGTRRYRSEIHATESVLSFSRS